MPANQTQASRLTLQDDPRALLAVEDRLSNEGRFEELYSLLMESATASPDVTRGALIAVRAASIAMEELGADTDGARGALSAAVRLDPSCEPAWKLWLEVASTEKDLGCAAECFGRLGWLAVDPGERARCFLQAGDAWRLIMEERGDMEAAARARDSYLAALRSIPPGKASCSLARRLFVEGKRLETLKSFLDCEPDRDDSEPAQEAAERHLRLGRLLAADPSRRARAQSHLLAAVESADDPGLVALEVLGGLHGLSETWTDMAAGLESEARRIESTDPKGAAKLLRRVVGACLEQPVAIERAEAALRRLVALDPEDLGSAERLVEILSARGRHREVVELLVDLAEISSPPTAALYLIRAGVLELARFGEKGASLRRFEEALERHPGCTPAATHLKEAYRESGRWKDLARVMVAEVEDREIDDRVLDVWREAGRILRDKAGDIVEATAVYRRIVEYDSMDEDAVRFFQEFHDRIQREAPEVDEYAQAAEAAESEADKVESLVRAADAALRLGSLSRSRSMLEDARARAPEDASLRDRFIDLLQGHGDHESAAVALAAEIDRVGDEHPDAPSLLLRLARLLLGPLGEMSRAREYLAHLSRRHSGPEAEEARRLLAALERDLFAAKEVSSRGFDGVVAQGASEAGDDPCGDSLKQARQALESGNIEAALAMASAAASRFSLSTEAGLEARELVADILIDHLGDLDEGLDRLGEIGRDRALPMRVRRRINETRVRLLSREVEASAQRDQALAGALLDAAAVAESRNRAYELRYRAALSLVDRSETWRRGADLLRELLRDDESSVPVMEALSRVYEREHVWAPLLEILWKRAEVSRDMESLSYYHRAAEVASESLDDPEEAVRVLRRALERRPGDQRTLEALVLYARSADDVEAEILGLRGVIAIEKDHRRLPALHGELATALERGEHHVEAAHVYAHLTELVPESAGSWEGLERASLAAGDLESAAAAMEGRARCTHEPSEAVSLLVRAGTLRLRDLGDEDEARRLLESALSLEPSHDDGLALMRDLAKRGGASPEQMVTLLCGAAAASDSTERAADLWCEAAMIHAGRLEHQEAARLAYERALEAHPGYAPAVSGLARLYLDSGETDEAAPLLEELAVHEDAPGAARCWALVELAELSLCEGDAATANAFLDDALLMDPADGRAHLLRGRLALQGERYTKAVESLTEAISLGERGSTGAPTGSELTHAYAALGAAWEGLGRTREAQRAWRKALSRDALNEAALSGLARIAEAEGDWEEVAEMRERTAELIPEPEARSEALALVGNILRDEAMDPRRALEVFRRAVSLNPENAGAQASVLAAARRLGRTDEAKDAALACARLAPDNTAAAEYLSVAGACAEAGGDREGSLDLARVALERAPACDSALSTAVEMLEARGSRLEAADLLERAAANSGDADSRRRYTVARARLLQDAGDEHEAAACLARAVEDSPDDGPLLVALAGCGVPPREEAHGALFALLPGLARHPLEPPRLMAVATLSAHVGDLDRSYLCGALLSLIKADDLGANTRTARLRDAIPEDPDKALPEPFASELLPEMLREGEAFYRAAEATILTTQIDRRPFHWTAPDTRTPSRFMVDEMRDVARALRLPTVLELRCGPEGSGVRPLPDRGRLVVAEDLLAGGLPGERRFALAFGLSLSVPGRRWVAAPGSPHATMDMLLAWARGEADSDTALELGERLGPGRHPLLASQATNDVPSAPRYMDAAVIAATRLGLLASGDLIQGLSGALRLLAPGRVLPRDPGALAAVGRMHTALGDMLTFIHDPLFLKARKAIGMAVPGDIEL